MRTRIKICGITNLDDALFAVEAGADALGFVFHSGSPRRIDAESVRAIVRHLPPFATVVGVFVDEKIETVREIARYCDLDLCQLHGDESPEFCEWCERRVIKAFRIRDRSFLEEMKRYDVSGFLLDAWHPDRYGGTGEAADRTLAQEAAGKERVILAGGLTPENVGEAIARVRPYGVDVSSGVEVSPGQKDRDKVRRFIEAVNEIDARIYGPENAV
ncbi:MAG: phosphoribosylanthranilate isomerase [Deltaproteobacteria bacterium]|nr:phosphoribosylanthranilate isomerase [Deltaproteobacteria bacterium]